MENKLISVVVPFYNEEAIVHNVCTDLITKLRDSKKNFEFLAVNDGSKDSTLEKLKKLESEHVELKVVDYEKNKGYGGAIITGLSSAQGEILGFMDGDGQISADDLIKCLDEFR